MVKVVKTALKALEYILLQYVKREKVGLTNISKHLGIRTSTLRNILKTMEECGYISRGEGKTYLPGYKCKNMKTTCIINDILRDTAIKILPDVAREAKEDLVLSTLINGERIVISRISGGQLITVNQSIMEEGKIYSLVTNRIMLAFSNAEEIEQFINIYGLPSDAEWKGVRSKEDIFFELLKIKRIGYSENCDDKCASIAFPVFDRAGKVVAAIGSYIPAFRCTTERMDELKKILANGARRLSLIL